MPQVRMRDSIADRNFSLRIGEQVEAHPEQAERWVAAGIAEYVADEAAQTPERRAHRETRRARPRNQP